jgi:Flp pilus assembly protein TadD
MRARWFWLVCTLLLSTSISFGQQWFVVQTDHLSSYSEGNDRMAREAAVRGEQLIGVFKEIFHHDKIGFDAPLRVLVMHPVSGPALVRTPAANIVCVDPADADSWTKASKAIATILLENNYPRAQPWFDSGIVSYIAGVQFNGEQMELGRPPHDVTMPAENNWIPLATLMEPQRNAAKSESQSEPQLNEQMQGESFALVRWLIDESRLNQVGVYLNAVEWRGANPERAMADAFSMNPGQFDQAVRTSLKNSKPKTMAAPRVESTLLRSHKIPAADVHVLQASLSLFGPEGDRTLQELQQFMRQNQENAPVHRALAWAFLLRGDLDNAVEHIRRALVLDDSDPSMHYLYARWVNQGEENKIVVASAETRMNTELKAAIRRDPNYAAAYELLGLAELNEGDTKIALEHLQHASALRPRSSRYYLNLGRGYESAGMMENARNLMLYARTSGDAAISADADAALTQLGHEKKQREQWEAMGLQVDPNAKHSKYDNLQEAIAEEEKADAESKAAAAAQDTRRVKHLKGRIVSVVCANQPQAVLKVNSEGSIWQLHVPDRNAAVLIGVDTFNCGWHGQTVTINYKRSGTLEGELVSLELH